jgi:hypothetical protein
VKSILAILALLITAPASAQQVVTIQDGSLHCVSVQ